jgi:hypothetical protein
MWITPGFEARTMELPWRGNRQNLSCIPDGDYICRVYHSRRFGTVYHITDVAGRTWILTHVGNWAGDKEKGLRSNSYGCVLMGKYHATIYGQQAVALSRATLRRWMNFMGGESFRLHVRSTHRRQ